MRSTSFSACVSFLALAAFASVSRAQFAEPVGLAPRVRSDIPGVERVLEIAQKDNRVFAVERRIAKEHPKRLTGSLASEAAMEWARAELASYGLEARLEKWGTFPVAFDRGAQTGRVVAPYAEDLTFITRSWTVGTEGPKRGPAVLEPKSEDELDKLAVEGAYPTFKGAWILNADSKSGKLTKRLREIYDAAGILGIVRSGGASGLLVMSGSQEVKLDKLSKTVDIRVLPEQFQKMQKHLDAGEKVELEFNVENRFTPGPIDCHNVVAELKGTRFPDEFVQVQGHFDAWDGAEGAQDNGTGSATTIEAARLVCATGVKPLRTIRFVLYTGEEEGLFGSRGFVKEHASELENTSVVFTHDAGTTFLSGADATYAMLDDFHHVLAPLEALDAARPFRIHEVDGIQDSGDSDHSPFIKKGVPSFFWHQSENGYDHVHHTQFDTLDNVDRGDLEFSVKAVAVAAIGFANLDHRIDRTDMQPVSRRIMGVFLDDSAVVKTLAEDGRAQTAGWKQGDKVIAIDGEAIGGKAEVTERLASGGSKKAFTLRRGTETIETTLDWSDEPAEKERAARAERKAAYFRAHGHPTGQSGGAAKAH